jgi:hypothetical protein
MPSNVIPGHCATEDEWPRMPDVDDARELAYLFTQREPDGLAELVRQNMERARLDREDYLEAICSGVNAHEAKQ